MESGQKQTIAPVAAPQAPASIPPPPHVIIHRLNDLSQKDEGRREQIQRLHQKVDQNLQQTAQILKRIESHFENINNRLSALEKRVAAEGDAEQEHMEQVERESRAFYNSVRPLLTHMSTQHARLTRTEAVKVPDSLPGYGSLERRNKRRKME